MMRSSDYDSPAVFCPWYQCSYLELQDLKRHVKKCTFAPKPRGRARIKAAKEPAAAEELFGMTNEEKGET